ncbi:MAG: hypothetical protein UX31_C0001G0010 [Candidatus Nomurabacteria bacterium GW2011_GWA1_46_11]|uniref:Uncharacterized protein n=1 Tax=Candidatus Nomurabacteria bacterium GW2011_GWA1_46_11 TaxID=1618732 RepID=A0A0G1NQ88_9BACT|nr:MAG: hypothetical protein UX31_C0001G0010 [Candidatus Nomurabacteria bacterium GW2011_GWA1_46_11]
MKKILITLVIILVVVVAVVLVLTKVATAPGEPNSSALPTVSSEV